MMISNVKLYYVSIHSSIRNMMASDPFAEEIRKSVMFGNKNVEKIPAKR